MASTLKHLRSSSADKRPTASGLADGQLAINTASGTPGLFFKDSNSTIVKVGPAHVGATAPNATPAGSAGNSTGEFWVDNNLVPSGLKVWNGSSFSNLTPSGSETIPGLLEVATPGEVQAGTDHQRAVTPSGLQSKISDSTSTTSSTTIASSTAVKSAYDLADAALPKAGGTVTGTVTFGTTGVLAFEGSTDDGFETSLAVVDPTADRTITLPNISGTVITTGDTGTVTSTMIADGTIVNGDINASAAIDKTKISGTAITAADTGTVTSTMIADATIVDGDISATAEIAVSKLADGTARQLLQTDAAGTGVEWASNIDIPGTLDVTSAATFDSSATIVGDLTVDTTTLKVDSTNNYVGIGTASPAALLDIGTSTPILRFSDANTAGYHQIQANNAVLLINADPSNATASSAIAFNVDGSEYARLSSSGQLGLGTASPAAMLDLAANNTTPITDPLAINNRLRFTDTDTTKGTDQVTGSIEWYTADATDAGVYAYISSATDVSGFGVINFATGAASTIGQRMQLDDQGRLLINTTSTSAWPAAQGGTHKLIISENDDRAHIDLVRVDTSIGSGNIIGQLNFVGGENSAAMAECASIYAASEESWTTTTSKTGLVFQTTDTGGAAKTEVARMTGEGYLRLATGGIQFNGDTAAANALDDYEEGTWSPTIVGASTAGTATYSVQVGRYTKIGNRVTFNIALTYSSFTGVGEVRVSLPITTNSTTNNIHTAAVRQSNYTLTANNVMEVTIPANVTYIRLEQYPVGGGAAADAPVDAAATLYITGVYESA